MAKTIRGTNVGRRLISVGVLSAAMELNAEQITMTTWYPAPVGVYQSLVTTGGSPSNPVNTILNRDAGNVGIGTTAPQSTLDVNGPVKLAGNGAVCAARVEGSIHYNSGAKIMEYCDGSGWKPLSAGVPSGTIAFFAAQCPFGWNEYVPLQGRYIVGTPSGGTMSAAVGTALNDQENRPTGRHNHALYVRCDSGQSSSAFRYSIANADLQQCDTTYDLTQEWGNTPGTGVAGTNAPYIQLRACQAP